ncbi:MAG TPA: efflux RND transporter periplasmic adaptor subunit [Kofleriaceae bacterium]|nr:efflux RND transporter periplasmic adaptor subunit [Kofleriaceae bacterium]
MSIRFGWPTMILLGAVGGLLAVGGVLYTRQTSRTNHTSLSESAKKVSAVAAVASPFQGTRRYVGTVEPWVEAKIGPQLVSAYVDTVLVRPGAIVKHNDVIATLDCRDASARSKQVAAEAHAVDALSTAAANEATRIASLLKGNNVSQNEVDIKQADAASKEAQVAALRAQLASTTLQVDDCVLRSPFDGEVAERFMDPGAFVRPGSAIATVVDRHLVRIAVDVPEEDFDAVAPTTQVSIHLLSTNRDLTAKISRRAPAADRGTRTARIEIDVEDSDRVIPVWTTAEISLEVGKPVAATAIPLSAASIHGSKATIFIAQGDRAHLDVVNIVGEHGGALYIDPKGLAVGTPVVSEGRTVLSDGDEIAATQKQWSPE